MIRAVLFDLDGTLVETERLKAISYARAANEMCPACATEDEVVNAFKEMVGRTREEIAQSIMKRFGLEDAARERMSEFHVNTPWQAYLQLRLRIFDEMIGDPAVIRNNQCPRAIEVLKEARKMGCKTGLTTSSDCKRTSYILGMLGILDDLDFIATSDDVEHEKPDPEIYCLVTKQLGVPPDECIALEDALPGVKAALAAGVHCIAVPTSFTRDRVVSGGVLDPKWIVDDPDRLLDTVHELMEELQS